MAFHTRRVKVKALNDSKEIAIIIYINSIILALLAVTQFALETYHDVYAAMFGLALLVDATMFLGLMFIPKVRLISINYINLCALNLKNQFYSYFMIQFYLLESVFHFLCIFF